MFGEIFTCVRVRAWQPSASLRLRLPSRLLYAAFFRRQRARTANVSIFLPSAPDVRRISKAPSLFQSRVSASSADPRRLVDAFTSRRDIVSFYSGRSIRSRNQNSKGPDLGPISGFSARNRPEIVPKPPIDHKIPFQDSLTSGELSLIDLGWRPPLFKLG